MQVETKEKEIAGRQTRSTQFPAIDAIKLLRKLAPAMTGNDMSGVAAVLDADHYPALLKNTIVVVDGTVIPLDKIDKINFAFSGKFLPALIETVAFVIETNFADFFVQAETANESTGPAK